MRTVLLALLSVSICTGCQHCDPALATAPATINRSNVHGDATRTLLAWLLTQDSNEVWRSLAPDEPPQGFSEQSAGASGPIQWVRIDSWSQVGVADGYMFDLVHDPRDDRFWIMRTGGVAGKTEYRGPARLDHRAASLIVVE